ncbi:uncharacterized protein G2W53_010483 [Senna tora]|uniref:Uncharacterized protein n=1 Tax=Senna tora TaxID=362788 RepID=A0A834X0B9_9FABA|nr:uncharacterized protein G2W53_010483 [Senna tora]
MRETTGDEPSEGGAVKEGFRRHSDVTEWVERERVQYESGKEKSGRKMEMVGWHPRGRAAIITLAIFLVYSTKPLSILDLLKVNVNEGQQINGLGLFVVEDPIVPLLPYEPTRDRKLRIPVKLIVQAHIPPHIRANPILDIHVEELIHKIAFQNLFPKGSNKFTVPYGVHNSVMGETPDKHTNPLGDVALPDSFPHAFQTGVLH